jgi:beta-galactosidase
MKIRALKLLSLLASIFPFLAKAAESPPRERTLFTRDWRFTKGDPESTGDALKYENLKPWLLPSANDFVTTPPAKRPDGEDPGAKSKFTQAGFDDSKWRSLDLPHDWGIESAFDQKLPGETAKLTWHGIGWYRKSFELPAADQGRRITLEIDGAMSYSAVWCNGRLVGGWPYGYASYQLNLTPYLTFGSRNTLAIRLDNPDNSSRWYPGGGIYRNVWLTKTDPVHLVPASTYITTPEVSTAAATIRLRTEITNTTATATQVRVATNVFKLSEQGKPEGAALATSEEIPLTIPPGTSLPGDFTLQLAKPALWDITAPDRHIAITRVLRNGTVIDQLESPFGIRTIRFTADDGFHLNGRRVPLRGVCLHHDLGSLGAAFNPRAAERQLEMMREMGCNAIRISHNPPAPEFLDLCDRMGFLVIDEFVDTWTRAKKPNGYAKLFKDWSEADWRAIIRRDRNHPSVILWSTGNEVGEQGMPELHPVSRRLTDIAREEDPTRLATVGCDRPAAGTNGFQKTVDVFGYNYKPHEYRKFREANPDLPLYGSETSSAVSSRGEYAFPVSENKAEGKIGFHMSSYDLYAPGWACPPDTEFKGQDENPSVAGEFVWTGFDYLGEPTPFNDDLTVLTNFHTPEAKAKAEEELKALGKIKPPSRSSYFGIIDLAGFRKDRFYIYQARWRPELPMAHLLPHWNWQDRIGEVTPVHAYTSGDEGELFLNGKSLGRKKKAKLEYRLRWDDVKYEPGELKIVTWKDGRPWATSTVKTTGAPAKLLLTADRTKITADGLDLSFLTATVADKDGQLVPRSNPKLKFEILGAGEIVSTDNGDPTNHTPFQSKERDAFNGLALAIVRGKPGADGAVTVKVTSDGLASAEITLNMTNP